jgi:hypothetical protein
MSVQGKAIEANEGHDLLIADADDETRCSWLRSSVPWTSPMKYLRRAVAVTHVAQWHALEGVHGW